VRVGDHVEAGDTLVVLEAMKMEVPIRAPRAAIVRTIHCVEGQLVQPGMMLVDLEMGQ
jgi:biotin carboxyl carrier protein